MENKYTEFKEIRPGVWEIWNKIYNYRVGEIRKERMGQWMHWQLFGDAGVGFSNGCLKEISAFITKLYGRSKNETEHHN